MRFAAVYREKNSLKGGPDAMRKSGEAWRKLSEAEKKPFADVASRDSAIYKKKFEEYVASGKKDAWARDPDKPKKPLTPYLAWSVERRKAPDVSKLSIADSAKRLAEDWKKVPQAEKDSLQAKFKTQTEKYNKDMETYKASGKEEAWLKRTGRLAATEKELAKKQAAKDKETKLKEKVKARAAKEKEQLKLKKQKEKEAKAKAAQKKKEALAKAKAKKEKELSAKKVAAERLKKKKAVAAKKKAAEAAKKKVEAAKKKAEAAKKKAAKMKAKEKKEKAAAAEAKGAEKALKQAQSAATATSKTA